MFPKTSGQTLSTPSSSISLDANISRVHSKISAVFVRTGQPFREIRLLAVTKTLSEAVARKAYASGLHHLGENRVQEAIEKYKDGWLHEGSPRGVLHLIGNLQANKVRKAVQLFDSIDSIDSAEIASKVSSESLKLGKTMRVLIEVNSSGESAKFGIAPTSVFGLAEYVSELPALELAGLMTVGPLTDDRAKIRSAFRQTKQLFDAVHERLSLPFWKTISMGMSGDFEIAIEEGATEIRLGTALFGARL